MEDQQQDAVVVMRAATRELFEVVSSSDTTKNIFDEECGEEVNPYYRYHTALRSMHGICMKYS